MSNHFLSLMAVGDAYGMKYEFVEHDPVQKSDLFFGPHPKFKEYVAAHYTDDTQMSLANAELLLTCRKPSEDELVEKWLEAFKRDPRRGYSEKMYDVLLQSLTVGDFRGNIDPTLGTTSGAAMRTAPFGLLEDIEEVKRLTIAQARITHDTQAGINSALAIALSVHFLHHGGMRKELEPWLEKQLGPDLFVEGYSENPKNGLRIVRQALDALLDAKMLSEVLINIVNQARRSDTDTIAAMAMVMASRCTDIADDLPAGFEESLENGAFGRDYLAALDDKLAAAFPRTQKYQLAPSFSRPAAFKPR